MNLDAQLLCHLANGSAEKLIRERIEPEAIQDDTVRDIYGFASAYYHHSQVPPSVEVLKHEFDVEIDEPDCDVDWLIQRLRETYAFRLVIPILSQASETLGEDPITSIDKISAELAELRARLQPKDVAVAGNDVVPLVMRDYDTRARGDFQRPSLGFPEVNSTLGGVRGLTVITGRLKQGKSWFGNAIALDNQRLDVPTAFFTLEMSLEEMAARYACMGSGVSWSRYDSGNLTRVDRDALALFGREMLRCKAPVSILHLPRHKRRVADIWDQARDIGAKLVIIDQLSCIEDAKVLPARYSRKERTDLILEDLKEMSDEIPVVLLAQLNREATSLTEMADAAHIALSDYIGQIADLILGIYSNKEMRKKETVEFGVIEGRQVRQTSWLMKWRIGESSRIEVREEKS